MFISIWWFVDDLLFADLRRPLSMAEMVLPENGIVGHAINWRCIILVFIAEASLCHDKPFHRASPHEDFGRSVLGCWWSKMLNYFASCQVPKSKASLTPARSPASAYGRRRARRASASCQCAWFHGLEIFTWHHTFTYQLSVAYLLIKCCMRDNRMARWRWLISACFCSLASGGREDGGQCFCFSISYVWNVALTL